MTGRMTRLGELQPEMIRAAATSPGPDNLRTFLSSPIHDLENVMLD
jgi:hypothetical protein